MSGSVGSLIGSLRVVLAIPAGSPGRSSVALSHAAKPSANTDAETTTTVITGLCSRLACAGTVDHPAVQCELHKLEQLLINQLDRAGRKPGRHRSSTSATVGSQPQVCAKAADISGSRAMTRSYVPAADFPGQQRRTYGC